MDALNLVVDERPWWKNIHDQDLAAKELAIFTLDGSYTKGVSLEGAIFIDVTKVVTRLVIQAFWTSCHLVGFMVLS